MKDSCKSFILCYIEGCFAYFTSASLDKQWGDDWNDAPFEHNAGPPYEWHEAYAQERYEIMKLAWDGPYELPCANMTNSYLSVKQINKGDIAWLCGLSWNADDVEPIYAGVTVDEFISKIKAAGGEVYKKIP